jgi:hypothetical protein
VQWDAPLAIGIEMNVHAYDVRSRPYSVLPGLAFSARQSLLRSVDELPILSVMLRDEWLQETFVTVGLDIPLLTSYLTLQYRHLLQPALSESVRFSGYDYHRVTNLYAPTAYGGVAVSWTAPFSLSGIF